MGRRRRRRRGGGGGGRGGGEEEEGEEEEEEEEEERGGGTKKEALTQPTGLAAQGPVGPVGQQAVVVTRDLARHHERLRHQPEQLWRSRSQSARGERSWARTAGEVKATVSKKRAVMGPNGCGGQGHSQSEASGHGPEQLGRSRPQSVRGERSWARTAVEVKVTVSERSAVMGPNSWGGQGHSQ